MNVGGFAILCLSLVAAGEAAEDPLAVLTAEPWASGRREMLKQYVREQADFALDRRLETCESLQTAAQIADYQSRLRHAFLASLGEFPPRTPLNPRVTGRLVCQGYQIEKLILESRPGFLVTANLYLPDRAPPFPAVLLPCGHSDNGKAAEAYQQAAILLANHGLAVLCYFITTTRRKNVSPGPGDAEQNIFGQIAYGMDHADYLLMRAPKPTLICSATHDFVPIEGAWEAYRQAKRCYTRLGFSERVDLVEADEKHGFTKPLRIAVTQWMLRWLCDRDEAVQEADDVPSPGAPPTGETLHSDQQLQCSPRGQVLLMRGARSVYDLYRDKAAQLARARNASRRDSPAGRDKMRDAVRELAGFRRLAMIDKPRLESAGTLRRDQVLIEKWILHVEPGVVLPALLFQPDQLRGAPVLWVHGDGKQADAQPGGTLERLAREGHPVLAVDLRGYGETETTPWRLNKQMGSNAAEFYVAYMLGRSLVGMRAEDILVSARYLAARFSREGAVRLEAVGRAGVPALHAAAAEPQLFSSVAVRDCLDSWSRVIHTPETADQLENTVHGALRCYDLPDLPPLCGDVEVVIQSPRDAMGRPVGDL